MHVSREMVSLESPVFTDKDTSILSDFVEDRKYSSPEDTLIYDNLRNDLNQALGSLSAKESEIIQHRFGLNDRKPLSLKEIGLKFKLTKERIRQIEKKAIQRLAIPGQAMELSLYMAG